MKKNNKIVFTRYFFPLVLIMVMVFIWYPNNHWKILMGDDLIAVTDFKENGFIGSLINATDFSLGKIRPIQKIILYFVYLICGIEYKKYYIVSRIAVGIGIFIIYKIMKFCEIDAVKSICIVILILTCPFSAYAAWQYIGITETFSLVCCVLYAYSTCLYYYEKDEKKCRIIIGVSSFYLALLIFNAERFMYMVVIHIIVILIKRSCSWKKKITRVVISIWPIGIRSLILKGMGTTALGTGRESIWKLLSNIIPYAIRGFVNMLGFSIGDSWHGGFSILQIPPVILVISCFRVFIYIGVLYTAIKKVILEKETSMIEILVWYIFSLSSLFSYALVGETHGEDRFLWVPYVFYLFALVKYVQIQYKNRTLFFLCNENRYVYQIKKSFIVMGGIVLVASNFYYYLAKGGVHFRYSQEIAQTAYDNIMKLGGEENIENVAFVNPNDYAWVFYGDSFVHYYLNENISAYYYDSVEQLNNDREKLGSKTVIIYPDLNYKVPFGASAYWIDDFNEEGK